MFLSAKHRRSAVHSPRVARHSPRARGPWLVLTALLPSPAGGGTSLPSPPLASPASAGPRPVSRVPRPAWVGGIGARGRETVTKPHGETQVKGRPQCG